MSEITTSTPESPAGSSGSTIAGITELHPNDLQFVVTRLPKDVRSLMRDVQISIGGGFIRETIAGQKPNDVDLFGGNAETLKLAAKLLAEKREGRLIETDNALTLVTANRMPVQFITRWLFQDPREVIGSFDFTVCQAVVWFDKTTEKWASAIGGDFYRDLAARRLQYTHPNRNEDAGGSLLRVRKFLARGYSIQAQSLSGVVARLALAVDWDRIRGDEAQATRVMTGLLREVDPLLVVDGVDVVDEHEVVE